MLVVSEHWAVQKLISVKSICPDVSDTANPASFLHLQSGIGQTTFYSVLGSEKQGVYE